MRKNRKIKVAFYTDAFNRGGTEKAILDLVNSLDYSKFDVSLIQFFPGGEYRKQLNKQIHKKCKLLLKEETSFRISWWMRNLFNRMPMDWAHKFLIGNKYDVEVACGYGYPTKLISNSKKAKKIAWIHMDVEIDKNPVARMTKEEGQEYFKNIDKIICVSKDCERKFNNKFDMPDKTRVCYNVVLQDQIIEKSNEKHVDLKENSFNIIAVGRLTWQKAFDILLRVHKRLIDEGLNNNVYIFGEGEDRKALEDYINENKLDDTAHLMGYCSNVYPYMKAGDMYVCSSRHESFSLTVAESICVGTPVLSTKCTGPIELLDGGKYGVLVENNEEALYQGLRELIKSPIKLEELRELSIQRRPFFNKNKMTQEWENELYKMCNNLDE